MSNAIEYNVLLNIMPQPFRLVNTMQNRPGYIYYGKSKIHLHEFYHLNYITSGKMTVGFKGNDYPVNEGQAFILPPNTEHILYSENGYSQIGLDIYPVNDPIGIVSLIKEKCGDNCTITESFPISTDYEHLTKLINNPSKFNLALIHNLAENIVLNALNSIIPDKRNAFYDKFYSMLQKNDVFKLTLNDMCGILGYSRTGLERRTLAHFGCGAIEYCNRLKLNRLCTLLRTTDLSLPQIAEMTSFYDPSHLSVFFSKRMGISPGKYRRINE